MYVLSSLLVPNVGVIYCRQAETLYILHVQVIPCRGVLFSDVGPNCLSARMLDHISHKWTAYLPCAPVNDDQAPRVGGTICHTLHIGNPHCLDATGLKKTYIFFLNHFFHIYCAEEVILIGLPYHFVIPSSLHTHFTIYDTITWISNFYSDIENWLMQGGIAFICQYGSDFLLT